MAATVITATVNGASASSGALAADSMNLSVTGTFGSKERMGDGATCEIQISDDGTNWVPAILGAPNGIKRVRETGGFQFMLRLGWRWRIFAYDMVAGSSIRVAVE